MVKSLSDWLKEQDVDRMPFRDGAKYTGSSFGLREDKILGPLSPYHPDVDRGALPAIIRMPFDGEWSWLTVGGDLGTLLRIHATDFPLEIQVGHTASPARGGLLKRGDIIPALPGKEGLAQGIHTHTGVLLHLEHEQEMRKLDPGIWFDRGMWTIYGTNKLMSHCHRVGWDFEYIEEELATQVKNWTIKVIADSWCMRTMPTYRQPSFGATVILIDSKKWLKI